MKCPFCGNEMDTLNVQDNNNFFPIIEFANKENNKQRIMQTLDKFAVCEKCGFVAPFIDPKELNKI